MHAKAFVFRALDLYLIESKKEISFFVAEKSGLISLIILPFILDFGYNLLNKNDFFDRIFLTPLNYLV